jgi:hypothetical protein
MNTVICPGKEEKNAEENDEVNEYNLFSCFYIIRS